MASGLISRQSQWSAAPGRHLWRADRRARGWRAGPLLVIAGAGTGKTSTIAHRVAQLVLQRRRPRAAAAADLHAPRGARDAPARARDRARGDWATRSGNKAQAVLQRLPWAGTFHAIGNRLLRHYARQLKLDPSFTVIDRADSADLLDEMRTAARPGRQGAALPAQGHLPGDLLLARQHAEEPARDARAAVSLVQGLGRGPHASCFAATSSASSAMRCSTTTICCSTGT